MNHEKQDRAWKHKYQICCIDSDGQHHIQQDPEGIVITPDVIEKYYTYDLLNGKRQKARRTNFSNDLDQVSQTGPVISCSNNQVQLNLINHESTWITDKFPIWGQYDDKQLNLQALSQSSAVYRLPKSRDLFQNYQWSSLSSKDQYVCTIYEFRICWQESQNTTKAQLVGMKLLIQQDEFQEEENHLYPLVDSENQIYGT